jgi:hypothetical protein
MRLAGTWKQYSPNAISQLTTIAETMGMERCFRWPYQAKVMNAFETINSSTVSIALP